MRTLNTSALGAVVFLCACVAGPAADDLGGPEADADTDSDSDADTDADTDSDTDSDTDTDTDTDTTGGSDSDSDGLSDAEEAALGTDPDDSDTDGDGLTDGDEIASGTSPLNAYSRTYVGGYHVGACDTSPTPTGPTGPASSGFPVYQPGDIVENFALVDQHGEEVDLYSFCGKTTLVVFGATWCGACQSHASQAQAAQDAYVDEGLQIIEVLISNSAGYFVNDGDLDSWASSFGLEDIPVLANDGTTYAPWVHFEKDWGIPTMVVIGPDMEVQAVDVWVTNPGSYL